MLDLEFPGGTPDSAALNRILAIVNDQLFDRWTVRTWPWREGALYAIPSDDGTYGIVKVLKLDYVGVHIGQYSNQFDGVPEDVDEQELFMAMSGEGRLGIGHLPVSARSFGTWGAVFVQQSTVRPDELEGYESWREAGGGYF